MKAIISYCVSVFLFISVNLFAQNDLSKLRSTFQGLQDKWNKAFVSGDVNALAGMYTEDAYSLPSNTPMWKGRKEILEGHKKDSDAGLKYTNATSRTMDVLGNGDIVYEIGTYSFTFIPPNSTEPMTDNGKYLDVWEKQADGSWKIKADIWNSDVNPESMNQAGAKEKNMDDNKQDKDK